MKIDRFANWRESNWENNRPLAYEDKMRDWWVEITPDPLKHKQTRVNPFLVNAYEVGELVLVLYKIFKKRSPPKDSPDEYVWLDLEHISSDEDYTMVGKIVLNDEQIGSINNYRHEGKISFLESISINKNHRNNHYCENIMHFLFTQAKNRGSKSFVVEDILTEAEGEKYKHNLLIFKKIAKKSFAEGIAKEYSINSTELNYQRFDMRIIL